MRQLIYQQLSANAALTELIGDRLYPIGSLGVSPIPAEPLRPYVQWGFDPAIPYRATKDTTRSMRHVPRFYVYDERGDFLRIDAIHELIRQTIEGLTTMVSPTGRRCTDAIRTLLGGDLTDNVRSLNVRQATYRIVSQ
jgi:hypothetical protein